MTIVAYLQNDIDKLRGFA